MVLGLSLFAAGAICGEIWIDSWSPKCYNFQYKMRCRGGKNKLAERAGSVFQFHARIMVESAAHCSRFSSYFGMSFCVAGAIVGEVGR